MVCSKRCAGRQRARPFKSWRARPGSPGAHTPTGPQRIVDGRSRRRPPLQPVSKPPAFLFVAATMFRRSHHVPEAVLRRRHGPPHQAAAIDHQSARRRHGKPHQAGVGLHIGPRRRGQRQPSRGGRARRCHFVAVPRAPVGHVDRSMSISAWAAADAR